MITAKHGNNRTRKFVYDKLNRPKEEQWLNSANTPIRTISNTYDAAGQLKNINDPDASYALTYEKAGNLETVDNAGTPNVPNVLLKYTYNQVNRPTSVTDTINGQLRGTKSFSYDDGNRVTRITQSGNGVSSKRVDMSYDAAGKTKDVARYSDLSGTGLVASSEYVYDSAGRLTRLSHGKGNVTLANYAWTYDFANRVTGFNSPNGSTNYSYDKRDQLTGADYSSGSDESYSYNDNGNRTSSGYQTGNNNQLNSDGVYNYEYDGEGNLRKRTDIVTGEVTEYSWDYRNRLTQVVGKNGSGSVIKSAQYSYDGLNRRIVREVDADGAGSGVSQVERLVYDGQQIALTFDGGGNQTHRYLHGVQTDEILADESAGGSVLWPLTDNLGTVRDLVDSNGAIQNRIGYDSFGKVRSQTNSSVGFRFGFTGRELDAETGNYYYNSRYYDPQVGRFISEDTVGFAGGDANLYRYVGNSPTNYTDPSGELPIRRWLGSDPSVYTGFAPWVNRIDRNETNPIRQRENQYAEAQRQWALQMIKNNAAYICDTANHYNVTPDAIAGAILWEALENPYAWLTRGQGPLSFTRPSRPGANDFGIPGKIHVKPGTVAELVENRVRQRRPDAFPQTIGLDLYSNGAPSGQVSVPISKVSAEDRRLILLQRDPTLAIEYIGAILDREARVFEEQSQEIDLRRPEKLRLGNYPIRDQAGLLTAFYQGVDPASGARAFEKRRGNFQRTGRADLYPPRPMLPRENATMGPWVSQYRWWIRNYLNECGCKPRSFTGSRSPILKVPYPNPGYPAP